MDTEELKKSVTVNLRCVTQSSKGGVNFNSLQTEYKSLIGKPIPFIDLGYPSLEAFLLSIPDVVRLKKHKKGLCMVEAVADSSTAHIASLISKQKNAKGGVKKAISKKPSVPVRKYLENWRSPAVNPEGFSKVLSSNSFNSKVPLQNPNTEADTSTASKHTTNQENVKEKSNHSVRAMIPTNTEVTNPTVKPDGIKSEQNMLVDSKRREGTSSVTNDSSLLTETSFLPESTFANSKDLSTHLSNIYSPLCNIGIFVDKVHEKLVQSYEVSLTKSQCRTLKRGIMKAVNVLYTTEIPDLTNQEEETYSLVMACCSLFEDISFLKESSIPFSVLPTKVNNQQNISTSHSLKTSSVCNKFSSNSSLDSAFANMKIIFDKANERLKYCETNYAKIIQREIGKAQIIIMDIEIAMEQNKVLMNENQAEDTYNNLAVKTVSKKHTVPTREYPENWRSPAVNPEEFRMKTISEKHTVPTREYPENWRSPAVNPEEFRMVSSMYTLNSSNVNGPLPKQNNTEVKASTASAQSTNPNDVTSGPRNVTTSYLAFPASNPNDPGFTDYIAKQHVKPDQSSVSSTNSLRAIVKSNSGVSNSNSNSNQKNVISNQSSLGNSNLLRPILKTQNQGVTNYLDKNDVKYVQNNDAITNELKSILKIQNPGVSTSPNNTVLKVTNENPFGEGTSSSVMDSRTCFKDTPTLKETSILQTKINSQQNSFTSQSLSSFYHTPPNAKLIIDHTKEILEKSSETLTNSQCKGLRRTIEIYKKVLLDNEIGSKKDKDSATPEKCDIQISEPNCILAELSTSSNAKVQCHVPKQMKNEIASTQTNNLNNVMPQPCNVSPSLEANSVSKELLINYNRFYDTLYKAEFFINEAKEYLDNLSLPLTKSQCRRLKKTKEIYEKVLLDMIDMIEHKEESATPENSEKQLPDSYHTLAGLSTSSNANVQCHAPKQMNNEITITQTNNPNKVKSQPDNVSPSLEANSVSKELLINYNKFYDTLFNTKVIIDEAKESLDKLSETLTKSQRRGLKDTIEIYEKVLFDMIAMIKNKEESATPENSEKQVPNSYSTLAAFSTSSNANVQCHVPKQKKNEITSSQTNNPNEMMSQPSNVSPSLEANSVSEELLINYNRFKDTLFNTKVIIDEAKESLDKHSETLTKSQRRGLKLTIEIYEKVLLDMIAMIEHKEESATPENSEKQVPHYYHTLTALSTSSNANVQCHVPKQMKNDITSTQTNNPNKVMSQPSNVSPILKVNSVSKEPSLNLNKYYETLYNAKIVIDEADKSLKKTSEPLTKLQRKDLKNTMRINKKVLLDTVIAMIEHKEKSATTENSDNQVPDAYSTLAAPPNIQREQLKRITIMNLQTFLLSSIEGVLLSNLQREYQSLFGIPIPYKELKYESLEAFIQSIPDVVKLYWNDGQPYIQSSDVEAVDIFNKFLSQNDAEAIPPPVAATAVLPSFYQREPSSASFQGVVVANAAYKPSLNCFPKIKNSIDSAQTNSLLMLNLLMFAECCYKETLKRGILSFDGFDFCEGSDKWKEREILCSMQSEDDLQECLNLLCIDFKSNVKKELVRKLLQFLASPSNASLNGNIDTKISEKDFRKETIEIYNTASSSSNNCALETVEHIQHIHNKELKTAAKKDSKSSLTPNPNGNITLLSIKELQS